LPTLELDRDFINDIKKGIPELPQEKRKRFAAEYFLDEKAVEIFVSNKDLGEYFEKVVSEFESRISLKEVQALIKLAANYLISDLQGLLQGAVFVEKNCKITPENFAEFITIIQSGQISSKIAKMVLEKMYDSGADPHHVVEEDGLTQITDEGEIEKAVKEVIEKNPKAVEDYKSGKQNALQFLVGQVMAKTKGRAKPETVSQLLERYIK
jgi:aspartyl-tRNA(Asn)/glutamyl-tRNA(Gln) amidotransferase subunit B